MRTVSNEGPGPFTLKINFEPHELLVYMYFSEISTSIKTGSDQIKISTQKTHLKSKLEKKLEKHVSMNLLEVSLSCLHFSLMFSEREVKSSYVLQVW